MHVYNVDCYNVFEMDSVLEIEKLFYIVKELNSGCTDAFKDNK